MKTAAEQFKQDPTLKLLIYGNSGTGKTTWSANAPRPFHILTEPQGLESIAVANPESMVEIVRDYGQIFRLLNALKRGAPCTVDGQSAFKFSVGKDEIIAQTLVIDSITEVHEMGLEHHTKGGKVKSTFETWGLIQRELKQLLSDLRSLPINVITIALLNEQTDDEGNVLSYAPALFGKAAGFAPRYFSGVGVTQKKITKQGSLYSIAWESSARYVTKRPPVPRGVDFPSVTTGSLGSILALLYPDANAARRPQDSAEQVSR